MDAKAALKPFAHEYAVMKRNNYIDGCDYIVRQNGKILGHAGIQIGALKAAYDTYVALGGSPDDLI